MPEIFKTALQKFQENPTNTLFALFIFLFPIGTVAVRHWATTSGYILIFLGFFGIRGQWHALEKPLKQMILAFLCYFAVVALSFVNSTDISTSIGRLGKLTWLIGFIFLVVKARQVRFDLTKILIAGFAVSGVVNAAVSIYEVYGLQAARATGAYNPIFMGYFTALAILFGFIGFGIVARSKASRIFLMGSICLNVIACGLAVTKSAWLVLIFMVPYAFWLIRRSLRPKMVFAILLFLIFSSMSVYLLHKDQINARAKQFANGFHQIIAGEKRDGSVGVRWEMWQAAFAMWSQNALLGTGVGDYRHDIEALKKDQQIQLYTNFSKAHNIYFEALSTTGILGFIGLIAALLVFPLRLFRVSPKRMGHQVYSYACLLGRVTIWAFAINGLVNSWLARNYLMVTFVVCVTVFASGCRVGCPSSGEESTGGAAEAVAN